MLYLKAFLHVNVCSSVATLKKATEVIFEKNRRHMCTSVKMVGNTLMLHAVI